MLCRQGVDECGGVLEQHGRARKLAAKSRALERGRGGRLQLRDMVVGCPKDGPSFFGLWIDGSNSRGGHRRAGHANASIAAEPDAAGFERMPDSQKRADGRIR